MSAGAGPKELRIWWRSLSRPSICLWPGIILMAAGWYVMWRVETYFNPIAFWSLWTGASLLMWTVGRADYPGFVRHLQLAALSIPVWWWFEFINARVQNWQYVFSFDYGAIEYGLLTSVAFSTVVPAISAAHAMIGGSHRPEETTGFDGPGDRRLAVYLVASGVTLQFAAIAFPAQVFPLVWVAPALIFDGLVTWAGGQGLVQGLKMGRLTGLWTIAVAGLICGTLWEFWNYWSMPKWEYDIPFVDFWRIFEMPLAGYLGYVPFVWALIQLVQWLDLMSAKSRWGLAPAKRSWKSEGTSRPPRPREYVD